MYIDVCVCRAHRGAVACLFCTCYCRGSGEVDGRAAARGGSTNRWVWALFEEVLCVLRRVVLLICHLHAGIRYRSQRCHHEHRGWWACTGTMTPVAVATVVQQFEKFPWAFAMESAILNFGFLYRKSTHHQHCYPHSCAGCTAPRVVAMEWG